MQFESNAGPLGAGLPLRASFAACVAATCRWAFDAAKDAVGCTAGTFTVGFGLDDVPMTAVDKTYDAALLIEETKQATTNRVPCDASYQAMADELGNLASISGLISVSRSDHDGDGSTVPTPTCARSLSAVLDTTVCPSYTTDTACTDVPGCAVDTAGPTCVDACAAVTLVDANANGVTDPAEFLTMKTACATAGEGAAATPTASKVQGCRHLADVGGHKWAVTFVDDTGPQEFDLLVKAFACARSAAACATPSARSPTKSAPGSSSARPRSGRASRRPPRRQIGRASCRERV